MPQRSGLHIAAAILGGAVLLFAIAGMVQFATRPKSANVITFDQAEFVPSSARRPPGDEAAWKKVTLPDQWRSRPAIKGKGWYRIKITLDRVPSGLQAVFVRHRRAHRASIYVNGTRVGTSRATNAEAEGRSGRGAEATLGMTISPHLLRPGENLIHIRMEGSTHPAKVHGLGRVYFGDARPLRKLYVWTNELGVNAKRDATVMALAAGIITLFLWLARRGDRVMLWFSIACLFWGTLGFVYTKLRWESAFEARGMLYFTVTYGLVVPTLILSLRTVDLKWPKLETALWLFFAFELSYPLWPGKPWPGALLVWDATNATLLLGAVGTILYAAPRPLHWAIRLQAGALAIMAAFMSFEIARYLGWVPVESPVMRHYHVPMMLLAMGAACFERHARTIKQTEGMNIRLEQRVAEKAREIEMNRARIERASRERALAEERQRILADMHDGMGATLVSLLRHVRSGGADPSSVKRRVQDALLEMRAAIAALQPRGGDLRVVLSGLRERLDALLAGSGIHLVWNMEELPRFQEFKPSAAYSLQRVLLEAVGNALKHSEAHEVRFIARACKGGDIEIRIEDDGKGFDPLVVRSGLGLGTMEARAEHIGATLKMSSRSGAGTVVRLVIPVGLRASYKERTDTAGKPAAEFVSTRRTGMVAIAAAASMFLAAHAPYTDAASSPRVIEFDQADFVSSNANRPPDDTAPWKPVSLPDQWRYRPDARGTGWYRMKFNLDKRPSRVQRITVPHRRAYHVAFFVNGKLVGTARDNQSMTGSETGTGLGIAIRHLVPKNILRAGKNVIHVRMEGSSAPALFHGLGRVYFGDARAVRKIYAHFVELGFSVRRELAFMTLAAGLIALFIWFARPIDKVMLWFSITCLSWGGMGFLYLMWRWSDLTVISNLLLFYTVYGLVVPTVILSLRTVDLEWPRFEAGLWVFFAVELSYPLWAQGWPSMHFIWDAVNSGLLAGAVGIILYGAPRPLPWPVKLQIAALVTMAIVMSYEIARYLGWVSVDSSEIRHFHVPIMLIAMGAACFERYARAIRQAERMTSELEERVAEKVHEIEANHAHVEDALREHALFQERQRILTDMHDGLGAGLINLLRYLDAGSAEMANVERRVQEALQELRVAIDALQPHGGDLAAVLGALRERINGLIAGSGVRLVWQVDKLPEIDELNPSAVFSLQRILLEAVNNVLRHSGATEIRFVAAVRDDRDVEICVEDNGRGFDPAQAHDGPGLANMRARAERIGAGFVVISRPGSGTVVRLSLPRAARTHVAERARVETESAARLPLAPITQAT